nr:MAG TPA: hypothetical protein [Caudoviricetes sp.]
MKIIHKPAEYGKMVKRGLFAFLRGLITLCWCMPVGIVSCAVWGGKAAKRVFEKHPRTTLTAISVILCLGWAISYMEMKTKLTTAEWQRDSLRLKVDSINELSGKTATYTRIYQR